MSHLYDLILQRKDELQTESVRVVDAAQAWRLGRERYPTASAVLSVAMLGVMALQLNHPNAARRGIRTAWDGVAARVARVELRRRSDGAVFQDPAGEGRSCPPVSC